LPRQDDLSRCVTAYYDDRVHEVVYRVHKVVCR